MHYGISKLLFASQRVLFLRIFVHHKMVVNKKKTKEKPESIG